MRTTKAYMHQVAVKIPQRKHSVYMYYTNSTQVTMQESILISVTINDKIHPIAFLGYNDSGSHAPKSLVSFNYHP